jgi:hypothetical protein
MRKSKELFDFNKENDYGKAHNDTMTMNLFNYTARHLEEDEEASLAFLGILYYQPSAQFTQWYGVLLTQKRLMVGLSGLFGKEFISFPLHEFSGISFKDQSRFAMIIFHHPIKNITVGVLSHRVDDIVADIVANSSLKFIKE